MQYQYSLGLLFGESFEIIITSLKKSKTKKGGEGGVVSTVYKATETVQSDKIPTKGVGDNFFCDVFFKHQSKMILHGQKQNLYMIQQQLGGGGGGGGNNYIFP